MRQRTVSLCRRNSEACSIIAAADINRSHISLNQLPLSRRQMSLTQSEPDSDKEAIGGGAYTHIHITHTHSHASPHKFKKIYMLTFMSHTLIHLFSKPYRHTIHNPLIPLAPTPTFPPRAALVRLSSNRFVVPAA